MMALTAAAADSTLGLSADAERGKTFWKGGPLSCVESPRVCIWTSNILCLIIEVIPSYVCVRVCGISSIVPQRQLLDKPFINNQYIGYIKRASFLNFRAWRHKLAFAAWEGTPRHHHQYPGPGKLAPPLIQYPVRWVVSLPKPLFPTKLDERLRAPSSTRSQASFSLIRRRLRCQKTPETILIPRTLVVLCLVIRNRSNNAYNVADRLRADEISPMHDFESN